MDEGGMEDMLDGGAGGEGGDILRSKLEAVLNEAKARQAENFSELDVLGERVPIKSEKVRIAILSSQQKAEEIERIVSEGTADDAGVMTKYDELFVAFNDALEGVRKDLRTESKGGKEQTARSGLAEASLLKLQASLTWQKLDHTVKRTMLLVEQFKKSLRGEATGAPSAASGGGGASSSSSNKRATPDDVVRLYESAMTSLGDMTQLDGYREEAVLMEQVAARTAAARACRCFYLAEAYSLLHKNPEAQALYGRAGDLREHAVGLLQEAGYDEGAPELDAVVKLEVQIDGAKARGHAQAILDRIKASKEVADASEGVGNMGLEGKLPKKKQGPLYETPNEFHRENPEYLIDFPPQFMTVPCKPVLFDIARNQIEAPDLSHRLEAQEEGSSGWGLRSSVRSLFGRSGQ